MASFKDLSLSIGETFIEFAIRTGAIELIPEGRKLRSGRLSPYFFNSGLFNTGNALRELAKHYVQEIKQANFFPAVVFGPSYKGSALASAIAMTLGNVGYAYNRKETKKHGEGGLIVGMPVDGKKVLIVDDVITTGGSATEAFNIVVENGGTPIGCVIAFDRQERTDDGENSAAQEFEQRHGISVRAVATFANLISHLRKQKPTDMYLGVPWRNWCEKMTEYRNEYGCVSS